MTRHLYCAICKDPLALAQGDLISDGVGPPHQYVGPRSVGLHEECSRRATAAAQAMLDALVARQRALAQASPHAT